MTIDWRPEVERQLRGAVSDLEWAGLERQGYIEDLELETMSAGQVADVIRKARSQASGNAARTSRPSAPWHKKRIELLGKIYEGIARDDPGVRRVRSSVYPERPIQQNLGAWIVGRYYSELRIQPGDELIEFRVLGARRAKGEPLIDLWYETDGRIRQLSVPQTLPLGATAKVAAGLSDSFRWHEWEATRWLLCEGVVPLPNVFRWWPRRLTINQTDTPTRLLLEVDPMLQPQEVADLYRIARADVTPRQRMRPLSEKTLALAELILDWPEDESWQRLQSRWNEGPGLHLGSYPMHGGGPSNFRRDARIAVRRLIYVGWE